jgi:hypothetical protein
MSLGIRESEEPVRERTMLFVVRTGPRGVRVSHCVPSEALAALASDEMCDETPPNMPEISLRHLMEWWGEYMHGRWSRG